MAEGGANVALGNVDPQDNWEVHFKDTVTGGAYLNNQKLVEILVKEGPDRIFDLEEYGAVFDRTPEGKIAQRAFGKQTYRRTCYASDRTGHEFMATLTEEVRRRDIQVMEEVFVTNLFTSNGRVTGAFGIDYKTSDFLLFKAKATVLAAGGTGRIYMVTTNAAQDTGDGYAMAYRAGASLIDMEMFQFHPTGMLVPESARGILVTEAVRGEGGILANRENERFMKRYDPKLMELSGRDLVARSIATEVLEGRGTPHGGVYLSVAHLEPHLIEERLRTMFKQFLDTGVDIRKEPMEVAPTAHHEMGGLLVDEAAGTDLGGLWATGEVAGGIQGGNRLGGNALLDTQVFGKRAGENAAKYALSTEQASVNRNRIEEEIRHIHSILDRSRGIRPVEIKTQLGKLMWNNVGIFRTKDELQEAVQEIEKMRRGPLPQLCVTGKGSRYNHELIEALEMENMALTAEMIARAALVREESRGAHFRKDFPKTDNVNWLLSIIVKQKNREMTFSKAPVTMTLLKPGA